MGPYVGPGGDCRGAGDHYLALDELQELGSGFRQQSGKGGQDILRRLWVRTGPGSLAVHADGLHRGRGGGTVLGWGMVPSAKPPATRSGQGQTHSHTHTHTQARTHAHTEAMHIGTILFFLSGLEPCVVCCCSVLRTPGHTRTLPEPGARGSIETGPLCHPPSVVLRPLALTGGDRSRLAEVRATTHSCPADPCGRAGATHRVQIRLKQNLHKLRADNEALQDGQDVPFDGFGLLCNPTEQHL